MPEEIIDIIHRLTYQLDDTQLQRATDSVSKQLNQIKALEAEQKKLSDDFAKTGVAEVKRREEIVRKIASNREEIKRLNGELRDNILYNKDLQAVLQKEQGIIGLLNTKLDLLRKKRDEATDVDSIRGYNKQISEIGQELAKLTDTSGATEEGVTAALGSLKSLAALAGVAFTLDGLKDFGQQVLEVTAKYEKFKAVLQNTFGSKGAADLSFRLISDYAAKTPYQVDEITDSFIKLVNRGFIPTQHQLTQIGDIAASQGKSYDQLVEAILDAQTAEFERLKEFGIIARQNGDKVTLTFKDQTVTVKKNTEAIRDAILAFGDLNGVMGSTESISNTLEGRMSNLADSWDRFLYKLGQGVAPAATAFLGQLSNLIDKLNGGIGAKDLNTQVAENARVQALFQRFNSMSSEDRAKAIQAADKELQSLIDTEATKLIPLEQRLEAIQDKLRKSFLGDKDLTKEAKSIREELNKLANVRPMRQATESILQQLKDQDLMLQSGKGQDVGSTKTVENVFAERLQALKARLAAIRESVFQSDETIRAKIGEAIQKDIEEVNKLLREGKLTAPQANILRELLGTIKKEEVDKALKEFGKARIEAQKRIDDEINTLLVESYNQRAELIRDDFERQNAIIEAEAQKQITTLKKAKETILKSNEENRERGLISEDVAKINADKIEDLYSALLNNVDQLVQQRKGKLALTLFDEASKFDKTYFTGKDADFTESVSKRVNDLTGAYLKGTMSFRRYQKELSRIETEETNNRRKMIELPALQNDLDIATRKLEQARRNGISSDSEINAIEQRVEELRKQIAELNREISEGEVTGRQASKDLFAETMRERIQMYQTLATAGVQAYSAITKAQEDAVSRDIDIQQRRVDRTQAIADRGNAKVLQEEEKRLNKLQQEREKFARNQIAINAAQTLSESTLAIANAAASGDGYSAAFRVIAVIAALAAGFAAVKQLSLDTTPGFFRGVVALEGPGTATSDSIPANLSRGESVITAAATGPHRDILEAMNAGRRFQLVDHDKIMEMTPYSTMPTLISIPMPGLPTAGNGGHMNTSVMEKRLTAIEQAVREIPGTQLIIDEHGVTSRVQRLIHHQNLLKKL